MRITPLFFQRDGDGTALSARRIRQADHAVSDCRCRNSFPSSYQPPQMSHCTYSASAPHGTAGMVIHNKTRIRSANREFFLLFMVQDSLYHLTVNPFFILCCIFRPFFARLLRSFHRPTKGMTQATIARPCATPLSVRLFQIHLDRLGLLLRAMLCALFQHPGKARIVKGQLHRLARPCG